MIETMRKLLSIIRTPIVFIPLLLLVLLVAAAMLSVEVDRRDCRQMCEAVDSEMSTVNTYGCLCESGDHFPAPDSTTYIMQ